MRRPGGVGGHREAGDAQAGGAKVSRTTHTDHRRPDGTPAARAARYLLAVVVVMAMAAGWKAAARWLTGDMRLADHSGVDPGDPPVLVGGVAAETEAYDAVATVDPDAPTRPPRSGARWTVEDDAYLRDHLDSPARATATALDRTIESVIKRRATLRREGRG